MNTSPSTLAALSDDGVERQFTLLLFRGRGDEHDVRLQQLLIERDKRRRLLADLLQDHDAEHRLAVHRRAIATHQRAASVHEQAANLHELHAAEMREEGSTRSAERAERIADRERELAHQEWLKADTERTHAAEEERRISGRPSVEQLLL